MSTRSVIGRRTGTGFTGVYHHWDGYPSGLGATLVGMYQGRFEKNLDALLKYVIDDHPGGWSTLNISESRKVPECFCHDAKGNKVSGNGMNAMTEKNASGCGCEYAYVFYREGDEDRMSIFSSYSNDGKMIGMFGFGDEKARWKLIAEVVLGKESPNFSVLDSL